MMKLKLFGMTIFAATLLVACNSETKEESKEESKIEEKAPVTNETKEPQEAVVDIKKLVNDYSLRTITDKSVSITSSQLIVTNDAEKETVYALPEDEFFVSIAPYINTTHPCGNHSLSGCQGEMVNEEFDVLIKDADGNIVVDETLSTQMNGFFDLWLPSDETYQIKIEHEDKIVESQFSTFEKDGTCLTTMQLK